MVYKTSEDSTGDLIKILLDKIEYIELFQENNGDKELAYFDVIYVDLKNNNITAFCEGSSIKQILGTCIEENLMDVPLKIPLSRYEKEFKIELPSEILYSLFDDDVTIIRVDENKYTLQNRAATLVETEDQILFLDPLLGLPMKIEFSEGGMDQVTVFDNLVSNKLKLEEMTYRPRSEIGTEEIFFR